MKNVILVLAMLFTLPAAGHAGYRQDFENEFLTKTWAGVQMEENLCISCHASEQMKPEFREITEEWKESWHAQNNISCENCHGGDPRDAAMAMSPQRGFIGRPQYKDIPEFCGKCHIAILASFRESGHGKAHAAGGTSPGCATAIKAGKKAPSCVTCHGSHNIQKASIDIINEQLCTQCHSYERAKIMKQALFLTEKKIEELDLKLQGLKREGIVPEADEKNLFSTQAEFRALFHAVDVNLVKNRTDEFTAKLEQIDKNIQATYQELRSRKNLSAFLMLSFSGMGVVIFLISRKNG
jgi:hypothetical protein